VARPSAAAVGRGRLNLGRAEGQWQERGSERESQTEFGDCVRWSDPKLRDRGTECSASLKMFETQHAPSCHRQLPRVRMEARFQVIRVSFGGPPTLPALGEAVCVGSGPPAIPSDRDYLASPPPVQGSLRRAQGARPGRGPAAMPEDLLQLRRNGRLLSWHN